MRRKQHCVKSSTAGRAQPYEETGVDPGTTTDGSQSSQRVPLSVLSDGVRLVSMRGRTRNHTTPALRLQEVAGDTRHTTTDGRTTMGQLVLHAERMELVDGPKLGPNTGWE